MIGEFKMAKGDVISIRVPVMEYTNIPTAIIYIKETKNFNNLELTKLHTIIHTHICIIKTTPHHTANIRRKK